jgi:hypothetical protein
MGYNDSRGSVPLAPFREAFLASKLTLSEMARRMGYERPKPNVDRMRRTLGLRPDSSSRDGVRSKPRQTVTYHTAVKLADALELDYTDMGI